MDFSLTSSLHALSQALLNPVIVVLFLYVAYAVVELAGVLVEFIAERRRFRVDVRTLMGQIQRTDMSALSDVFARAGLLPRQRRALTEVVAAGELPQESFEAFCSQVLSDEELHYRKIVDRDDLAAKIAPMFGLMGTLIPLGPGVVALGQGGIAELSTSLLVAFDTTVAGLVAAAVFQTVSKARKYWYEGYLATLESLVKALAERMEGERSWMPCSYSRAGS